MTRKEGGKRKNSLQRTAIPRRIYLWRGWGRTCRTYQVSAPGVGIRLCTVCMRRAVGLPALALVQLTTGPCQSYPVFAYVAHCGLRARLNLSFEKINFKMRVSFSNHRRMVTPTMMAF